MVPHLSLDGLVAAEGPAGELGPVLEEDLGQRRGALGVVAGLRREAGPVIVTQQGFGLAGATLQSGRRLGAQQGIPDERSEHGHGDGDSVLARG